MYLSKTASNTAAGGHSAVRLNNQGRYGPMANHRPTNSAHRGGNHTWIRPVVVACFYSARSRKRRVESAM